MWHPVPSSAYLGVTPISLLLCQATRCLVQGHGLRRPPQEALLDELTYTWPQPLQVDLPRSKSLATAAVDASRLLTPEEKKAMLPAVGQLVLTSHQIVPGFLLFVSYLAWSGRHTYRVPLYSLTLTRLQPGYFPVARRWAPIYESLDRSSWHLTRVLCYNSFTSTPCTLVRSVSGAVRLLQLASQPA